VKNGSATVRFLTLFSGFRSDIAQGNLDDAATLMVQFIVSKIAPREFWPTILEESFPIFEANDIAIKYETMTSILSAVDQIANPNYGKPLIFGERLKRLRQALLGAVKNSFEF
jgi:hypothetical protein